MVFWRVHALYLSADNLIYITSLSVVSYDGSSAHASDKLHMYFLQGDDLVSHVTSLLGIHVMYTAWNPKDKYDMSASVFVLHLMALCHSQVSLMLCTDINITETTYSCQFQYVFGNQ